MARVVLIGPIAAGKSTVAEILADRLGVRQIPIDLIRWGYYFRAGYDRAVERRLIAERGPLARFDYWKPFEVDAVERALRDYPEGIIDFGAGHSVYDDPTQFARVQEALATVEHVVLLLPSPDPVESLAVLLDRIDRDERDEVTPLLRSMLANPSNAALATATVFTAGLPPQAVCDAIERLLRDTGEIRG